MRYDDHGLYIYMILLQAFTELVYIASSTSEASAQERHLQPHGLERAAQPPFENAMPMPTINAQNSVPMKSPTPVKRDNRQTFADLLAS